MRCTVMTASFPGTACSRLLYYKQWKAGRGLGLRSQWHSFIPDGKVSMTNRVCSMDGGLRVQLVTIVYGVR